MTSDKVLITTGIIIALGILAVIIGIGGDGAPAKSLGDSSPSIEITSSGDAQGEPDMSIISISVEADADNPSIARDRVASNMNNLMQALESNGVSRDEIKTTSYTVRERTRHPVEDRETDPGYRATHSIEVELNNTERTGEIIDVALDNGATSIDNIRYTLSSESRASLKANALSAAMDKARGQAETVAESADLRITEVRKVMSTDTDFSPYIFRAETAADSGATDISVGPVSVDAQVTVVYNVE